MLNNALVVPSTSKFSYLVGLVSIITALGIRAILTGFGWMVTCRRQVRPYPLHLLAAVLVFLLLIEGWWGTFSKRLLGDWHFGPFLVLLITPILYYVVAELLFPSRQGPAIDFRVHYWENFRWFYGIAALIQLNNIFTDALMPTDGPSGLANAIRISASVLLTAMAILKSARLHACAYAILVSLFALFLYVSS